MSITPPPNVSYGRVVWQALSDVTDGPDAGTRPDFIAPTGEVTFVASTVVERNATATPNPVSILRDPITGVLDSEGYLCTPGADGLPDYRGVDLIATDDPDLNPTDWVYNVSYKVKGKNGRQIALAPHQIYVPTDAVVDLTTVGPVDNATAIGIPQAEALAAQAAAAAADASVAASQALAAADAAEDAAAAAQSSVVGKQDKSTLDADMAAKVTTSGSATQTALSAQEVQNLTNPGPVRDAADARVAAGIGGKQDKTALKEDVGTVIGQMGAARDAVDARVSTGAAFKPEVLPIAQGARGDYTGRLGTAGTGTDSRAAIQAALNAASSRTGTNWYSYLQRKAVKVTLPPGHYIITAPSDGTPSLVVPEGVEFDTSAATLYFDYPAAATGKWCAIQLGQAASLRVGTIAPSGRVAAPDTNRLYDGVRSVASDNFQTYIKGNGTSEIRGFQGAAVRLIGSWITHVDGIRFTSDLGVVASCLRTGNVYGIAIPADMANGSNRTPTDLYFTNCYFNENRYGGFIGPISGDGSTSIGGDVDFTAAGGTKVYFRDCGWEYFNALAIKIVKCATVSLDDCFAEEVSSSTALVGDFDTIGSVHIKNFRLSWGGANTPGPGGTSGRNFPTNMFRTKNVGTFILEGGSIANSAHSTLHLFGGQGGDVDLPKFWSARGVNNSGTRSFVEDTVWKGNNLHTQSSVWNAGHLVLGNQHIWTDSTGALRHKNGAPTSDTDGAVFA